MPKSAIFGDRLKTNPMKKTLLITAAISLFSLNILAQSNSTGTKYNRCGTQTPTKEWDEWFNQKVEKHKQNLATGRTTSTTYTIPVIFHIIYSTGEVEGALTSHNISQAQVDSQIAILNADYAGTGFQTSQYATMGTGGHAPFYDYAVANSLSAPDANGTVIANSRITFSLAVISASGTVLAEPGIDRVTWESISGATNPATSSDITALFDGTIKPSTIWDPTRYFNVWVSDGGTSGLLGYSTLPSGTSLTGLNVGVGGSTVSTSSTDGAWIAYNAIGNTGVAASPYNHGRVLTHESGHYFGLRHIWGDSTCATDYCNDTPPASAANYVAWPTAYPYLPNSCSGNGLDGDMFMNFMDYSDDAAMWMFTTDQVTRMITALTQCPNRSGLNASAATVCNLTPVAPIAAFTYPSNISPNVATTFSDASSGYPTSWTWSVVPNTGVTINTSTSHQNPTITFSSIGTYSVTLIDSNSVGTSSVTNVATVTVNTPTANFTYLSNICPNVATTFSDASSGYPTSWTWSVAPNTGVTINTSGSHQNPAITFPSSGTYSVTLIDSNSVGTSSVTNVIAITINTPTLSFTLTPDSVPHVWDVYINYSANVTNAIWYWGDGTDTLGLYAGHSYDSAGRYNICVTAYSACGDSASFCQNDTVYRTTNSSMIKVKVLQSTTGIKQQASINNQVSVYPNPNNGTFTIKLNDYENTTVEVYNTIGQKVFNQALQTNLTQLNLAGFSNGMYQVRVLKDNTLIYQTKVVKQE